MIGHAHIEVLREQVARAQRELKGWEQLLEQAERSARGESLMPDPLMPTGQPWTVAPPSPAAPAGRQPYETAVMPPMSPIDGSDLPPRHKSALETLAAEHDAYASSPDGVKEDRKWRSS